MTGEEWKAWAMSLKPGDKAIVKYWRGVDIAIVQKVTPSGRVNTSKGVFALNKYGDWYEGYGKTSGYLFPATPELIAEAERQARTGTRGGVPQKRGTPKGNRHRL